MVQTFLIIQITIFLYSITYRKDDTIILFTFWALFHWPGFQVSVKTFVPEIHDVSMTCNGSVFSQAVQTIFWMFF